MNVKFKMKKGPYLYSEIIPVLLTSLLPIPTQRSNAYDVQILYAFKYYQSFNIFI